jgi:tripartite-type tricarboxylate transporter receptor subunit TctC
MRALRPFALATLLALALAQGVRGEDSSSRPVTLVIPTSPGTAADITARIFAPRLQQAMDRSFVVENRTGASGNIGVASVIKAPPDGHTLLVTASTLAVTPLMTRNLGWDPVHDLQPIALLSFITYVLLVNPAVPAYDLQGLIGLARQKPGALNYGSPGTGTPHQLAMELLKQKTGIDITHVPYKGTAAALTDLLGGRVETAFFPVHNTVHYAQAGKLRMIGSVGQARTPWTPDLPTLAEQGVPGIDVDAWIGVYAPLGLPPEIASRLTREFLSLINEADIRRNLFQQGIVARPGGPAELTQLLVSDMNRYRKVIEQAGITGD